MFKKKAMALDIPMPWKHELAVNYLKSKNLYDGKIPKSPAAMVVPGFSGVWLIRTKPLNLWQMFWLGFGLGKLGIEKDDLNKFYTIEEPA